MKNLSQPEQGYESPQFWIFLPAADASTQTTDEDFTIPEPTTDASTQTTEDLIILEPTKDASTQTDAETNEMDFQTPLQNFEEIVKIHSNGCASISTLDVSADISKSMFPTLPAYENVCASVNSPGSNICFSPEALRDDNMPRGYQDLLAQKDTEMIGSIHTPNRKRSVSNRRMTTKSIQAHKRSRSEICNESDTHLSNGSEQKSMSSNKALEIGTTSQTVVDNRPFACIDKIQIIKQSSRICSAAPDPSDFNRNENSINMNEGLQQSRYHLEMLSMNNCEEGKSLMCTVCKSEISKHAFRHGGKIVFECCICIYSSIEQANLQIHSDTHLPKSSCNICGKEHTEGKSHESEHTCTVCKKTFQCRTRLDEHILDHRSYLKKYCWACSRTIDSHITKDAIVNPYFCCFCPYTSDCRFNLRTHIKLHRPKIFCSFCKEEYPIEKKGLHNSKYTCVLCMEQFQCQTQLEDHTIYHEEYFNIYCRVCDRGVVTDHKIESEKNPYKCCKCYITFTFEYELLNHLYTHTQLNIFKCDMCGKRFEQRKGLNLHFWWCPAVPYKCKKCEARFPRSDFLHLHCSVKHSV